MWKLGLAAIVCTALAACGGGGSSGNPFNPNGGGYGSQCSPGTNVQLARPATYQSGVSTNIGSIEIVADGNSNQLYNTYANWSLILQGNFSGQITSGQLNLAPADTNGPHPFPSDYYYSASIPTLPAGESFQVELVNNTGYCTPVTIGTFST